MGRIESATSGVYIDSKYSHLYPLLAGSSQTCSAPMGREKIGRQSDRPKAGSSSAITETISIAFFPTSHRLGSITGVGYLTCRVPRLSIFRSEFRRCDSAIRFLNSLHEFFSSSLRLFWFFFFLSVK